MFTKLGASSHTDRRIVFAVIISLLAGLIPLLFIHSKPVSGAPTTPPGFTDQFLASVGRPTALAFTPDGRLLVANQDGKLRVYENGALRTNPALDISANICSPDGSRGLLGVAVDPNFAANNYIYIFYTFKKHGVCEQNTSKVPVNRVERYVLSDSNIASPDQILVDNIPAITFEHLGGDLHFGKDGYLYITVGDGGCDYAGDSGCMGQNDASRDQHTLLGKILRITRNGGIPATNPYQGTGSARCNLIGSTTPGKKCQETFASGLRNPYRFAFDPNASGTRFFVNDVGQGLWEEVDEGKAGADYAWNLCEGNHDNPNMPGSVNCGAAPYTPPIHEYNHDTGCTSITGAAFVPNGVWPASYDGSYLYSDFVCDKIFQLKANGTGGFTRAAFVTGLGGSPVAMTFGPYGSSQALYYTTYGNGGEVRRIAYTGDSNRFPSATLAASPTSGTLPLVVNFDGSASVDPDAGDTLRYHWNFGDGSATKTTTIPNTSYTYSTKGTYTASLSVEDNHGAVSDPDTVRIDAGNVSPTPVISSPSADQRFKVGWQITLSGSATDPEDGQLPSSSFSWNVLRHHNGSHTHLAFSGTGNNRTFTAPPPEDLSATGAGNHLEIRFTATDSDGLSKTVSRVVQPNRVDVTFGTNPGGLSLLINGETFTTPRTLVSWEGYGLTVNAPSPQTLSETTHAFSSWSDGKSQQHAIVTEAQPSTYTATFNACTRTGTTGADALDGTSGADVICGLGGNDTIRGLGSNDTLEGMGGDDTLRGGGGADRAKGGLGADGLYGNDGNDTLDSKDGVSGNDLLDGGAGTDSRISDATERSIVGFP